MEIIKEDECDEDRFFQARSEWDEIETLPIIDLGLTASSTEIGVHGSCAIYPSVTIEELDEFINTIDLSEQLTRILPENQSENTVRSFIKRILFLDPPTIKSNRIKSERDRIFALALRPFDDGQGAASKNESGVVSNDVNMFQTRMLFTLYRILTRCPLSKNIKRIGPDWESIGFQGNDPATDFRGVGLLGLYQLFHFVLSTQTSTLAMDTFALSLDKIQSFPFCIMSINLTSLTLQLLRNGVFNRDINSRCAKQDYRFVNCFNHYHGLAFKILYQEWKFNHRTIKDAGFVIVSVRKTIKILMKGSITSSTIEGHGGGGNVLTVGKKPGWKTLKQAWQKKLKRTKRSQTEKVVKEDTKNDGDDVDIMFTDLNVIQTTDSDEEDVSDIEFKTPEPGVIEDENSDLRPFTPYDDDSLDGASITKERRLI